MNFTPKELKELISRGFEKTTSPNSYEYTNGVIIVTVEKVANGNFTFYNDMCGDDDLLKANNNQTLTDLTWKEVIEEIEGSF